jgi:acyl carrier protein
MLAQPDQQAAAWVTRRELGLPGDATPPANAVEAELLDLFTTALEVVGLGADDDFFNAGGDSLRAASLFAAIEHRFGTVIPVSTLLSAGTVRQLSQAVRAANASPLVAIRDGHGPASIFVHGLRGDVVLPRMMAPAMDDGRRMYGLRAPGLASGETALDSLVEMAACYVRAVVAVEPSGPYLIGGYCGGSVVAYEMARQMREAGMDVAGVALVDPPIRPDYAPWLHGLPPGVVPTPPREGTAADEGEQRRRVVRSAFETALSHYVPQPFGGRALVVHCRRRGALLRDAGRGWPSHVGPGLRFAVVDVDHHAMFSEGMTATAQAVQRFFAAVAPVPSAAARV